MPKKPINIQAAREAKSKELEAEQSVPLAPGEEMPETVPADLKDPEDAAAKDAAEMQNLAGPVQVSLEDVFAIIGSQEYELRTLRQRVPALAQQVVTLKGVIRGLEAAARK
jgi:hypothetical protein